MGEVVRPTLDNPIVLQATPAEVITKLPLPIVDVRVAGSGRYLDGESRDQRELRCDGDFSVMSSWRWTQNRVSRRALDGTLDGHGVAHDEYGGARDDRKHVVAIQINGDLSPGIRADRL